MTAEHGRQIPQALTANTEPSILYSKEYRSADFLQYFYNLIVTSMFSYCSCRTANDSSLETITVSQIKIYEISFSKLF